MAPVKDKPSPTRGGAQMGTKRRSSRHSIKTETTTPQGTPDKSLAGTSSKAKPSSTKKRTRTPIKAEVADNDELPHNLGQLPTPSSDDGTTPARKKRSAQGIKSNNAKQEQLSELEKVAVKSGLIKNEEQKTSPKSKSPKKAKVYGLTPGETPYPQWPHPTAQDCHDVTEILSKAHGRVKVPDEIKPPSLTSAGCGEVPSVLDAMIRTRLSAATTDKNSSTAFQGLVKTFGVLQHGVGKNSVNWNKVRLASQQQVFEAIKSGGLANNKSKDIKQILDMVYEENQARGAALKDEGTADPVGAEHEPQNEKSDEIARADEQVLSLDHLHLLSDKEAFDKLVTYPGIGPKTASCVSLFCLRRPSFAVDTHVFRLCQYLGWVPPNDKVEKGQPRVGRETCFSHCQVRVPDKLKYPLHQLLIKHGKMCPRCRAATGLGSKRWDDGCPIEKLVKRHGAKKGGSGPASPVKKRGKKDLDAESDETDDDDLSEPSDVGSDETDEDMSELSDVGSDDDK